MAGFPYLLDFVAVFLLEINSYVWVNLIDFFLLEVERIFLFARLELAPFPRVLSQLLRTFSINSPSPIIK